MIFSRINKKGAWRASLFTFGSKKTDNVFL